MVLLDGCGHIAPYSEAPLDYVEIYRGVEHPYQLRVITQVQVYDLIPTRYVHWKWIPLAGADDSFVVDSEARICPEGSFQPSFLRGRKIRGTVVLDAGKALIQLEQITTNQQGVQEWQPFPFNGRYSVVHATRAPQTSEV